MRNKEALNYIAKEIRNKITHGQVITFEYILDQMEEIVIDKICVRRHSHVGCPGGCRLSRVECLHTAALLVAIRLDLLSQDIFPSFLPSMPLTFKKKIGGYKDFISNIIHAWVIQCFIRLGLIDLFPTLVSTPMHSKTDNRYKVCFELFTTDARKIERYKSLFQ